VNALRTKANYMLGQAQASRGLAAEDTLRLMLGRLQARRADLTANQMTTGKAAAELPTINAHIARIERIVAQQPPTRRQTGQSSPASATRAHSFRL